MAECDPFMGKDLKELEALLDGLGAMEVAAAWQPEPRPNPLADILDGTPPGSIAFMGDQTEH